MDYHTRFLKGVHEGAIDMFAQDAHLNLGCLHYAGLLLALKRSDHTMSRQGTIRTSAMISSIKAQHEE